MKTINIAIDGPSGAGKSTAARMTAERLGFIYIDTGALYRTVGVAALRRGIDTTDPERVGEMLSDIRVTLDFVDGLQHVYLNGDDVSEEIRLPASSMAASNVSAHPAVRAFLAQTQKDIAASNNCVMDGRDIGTTILPDADVKIFLTASPEVRAKRRFDELVAKGNDVDFDTLLAEVKQRDHNDSHRAASPLRQAEDAHLLDSSDMDLAQMCDAILEIIRIGLEDKRRGDGA